MDGNRARFAAPDWKTVLVVKTLRSRLRELLTRSFKNPGKLPTPQHQHWLEAWQQIYEQAAAKDAAKAAAAAAAGGS